MKSHRYSIDLIKQMAECDANYIRLLKLIPGLRTCRISSRKNKVLPGDTGNAISCMSHPASGSLSPGVDINQESLCAQLSGKVAEFYIASDPDQKQEIVVEISVIESFRYTTTLEIVQRPETGKWISNPTMQVRVYHDANTAEVMSYQSHKGFQPSYPQPNPNMYYRDEKTQVNRFLGEWLTHCLEAGRCIKVPDLAFSF